MKTLLAVLLRAYFIDMRKLLPPSIRKKTDADIAACAARNKEMLEMVQVAKLDRIRRPRNWPKVDRQISFGGARLKDGGTTIKTRAKTAHVEHVPCRRGNRSQMEKE